MANVPALATEKPRSRAVTPGRSPGAITRRQQVRHGFDATADVLHIGPVAVPISSVESYQAVGLNEKDLSTAFATMALFSGVAAVMIFLVVEIGWRAKFLLEGVLFGSIAMCAGAELFSARRSTLFTFELTCGDGSQHTFSTASRPDAEALKLRLDEAGAAVR
jgi:hypothetical protein